MECNEHVKWNVYSAQCNLLYNFAPIANTIIHREVEKHLPNISGSSAQTLPENIARSQAPNTRP